MAFFRKKKDKYPMLMPPPVEGESPDSDASIESMENMDTLRDFVNYPLPEEKQGIFQFFNKVLETDDTSKVGNLSEPELNAVRLYQGLALYAHTMGLDDVSEHMVNEGEVMLSTSDSKHGFMIRSVITSRKEWKAGGEGKQEKKGWFGKGDKGEGGGEEI